MHIHSGMQASLETQCSMFSLGMGYTDHSSIITETPVKAHKQPSVTALQAEHDLSAAAATGQPALADATPGKVRMSIMSTWHEDDAEFGQARSSLQSIPGFSSRVAIMLSGDMPQGGNRYGNHDEVDAELPEMLVHPGQTQSKNGCGTSAQPEPAAQSNLSHQGINHGSSAGSWPGMQLSPASSVLPVLPPVTGKPSPYRRPANRLRPRGQPLDLLSAGTAAVLPVAETAPAGECSPRDPQPAAGRHRNMQQSQGVPAQSRPLNATMSGDKAGELATSHGMLQISACVVDAAGDSALAKEADAQTSVDSDELATATHRQHQHLAHAASYNKKGIKRRTCSGMPQSTAASLLGSTSQCSASSKSFDGGSVASDDLVPVSGNPSKRPPQVPKLELSALNGHQVAASHPTAHASGSYMVHESSTQSVKAMSGSKVAGARQIPASLEGCISGSNAVSVKVSQQFGDCAAPLPSSTSMVSVVSRSNSTALQGCLSNIPPGCWGSSFSSMGVTSNQSSRQHTPTPVTRAERAMLSQTDALSGPDTCKATTGVPAAMQPSQQVEVRHTALLSSGRRVSKRSTLVCCTCLCPGTIYLC